MGEEEKKAIDFFKTQLKNTQTNYTSMYYHVENLELILNLIEKQQKIIDNAINEVEKVRQYFDDGLQPEFIGILEILKDKKVIDW